MAKRCFSRRMELDKCEVTIWRGFVRSVFVIQRLVNRGSCCWATLLGQPLWRLWSALHRSQSLFKKSISQPSGIWQQNTTMHSWRVSVLLIKMGRMELMTALYSVFVFVFVLNHTSDGQGKTAHCGDQFVDDPISIVISDTICVYFYLYCGTNLYLIHL